MATSEIAEFAAVHHVEAILAGAIEAAPLAEHTFEDDPRVDFGRFLRRTPRAVLRPRDREQLAACVRFLGRANLPYKTRGAAHSSGGQVLIDDGVVIDLRFLDRIIADDPRAETITVEAGIWWLALVSHLRGQGRRPRCVTANLRCSVGGTLAVGGFGDSSHIYGLQIASVERLTVMTPDGECRELTPRDELFFWVLGGSGQLGIIVDVTLQTLTRPWTVATRTLRWARLDQYLRDLEALDTGWSDFLRARLHFKPRNSLPQVSAVVGWSSETARDAPELALLSPASSSRLELLDLYAMLTGEKPASWLEPCPALEIVLPLPHALSAWPEIARQIVTANLPYLQPEGHSVMVVPCDARYPLAPLPAVSGATHGMMVALRPTVPTREAALALLPALKEIGRAALACGGRIYLMSIELDLPDFASRQFGAAFERLVALKRELDPRGLLNPGLL